MSKRPDCDHVENTFSGPGKVLLTTTSQVSSHHHVSEPCEEKLNSSSQDALPMPVSSDIPLHISKAVSDSMDDVRKNSSCPDEQNGLLLSDPCSELGKLREDVKSSSSPKVHRTKRFRLFSCRVIVITYLKTNGKYNLDRIV